MPNTLMYHGRLCALWLHYIQEDKKSLEVTALNPRLSHPGRPSLRLTMSCILS